MTTSLTLAPAGDLVLEGSRLRDSGDWAGAEKAYRRAAEIEPGNPFAWAELGCLLSDARRFREAASCFSKAQTVLELEPEPDGEMDDAHAAVQRLAAIAEACPEWVRGQFSLGTAWEHLGDFERARMYLGNALRLDPTREAAVQSLVARMFCLEEKWSEGLAAADRALASKPDYFLAHVVRSRCCAGVWDWIGSAESARRAVEIFPEREIHSSLLFDMNYLAETSPETLYSEASRWNALYAAPLAAEIRPHPNTSNPERKLKIGYVSPDLWAHPLAKFFLPVLERHNRRDVEVFVYSVGSKCDQVTEWIRARTENFVESGGPHTDLASRVRADGIDILVDLAGHTTGQAYLAFALKPAPIQISWLGVLSTTGLRTIDYFLGDADMPCPGTEHSFSEAVYRLPRSMCCYRPTDHVPVAPPPSLSNGYVTFGCFNNPRKINRDVVKLWSAILHMVPDSRLLMKWHGLEAGSKQVRLRQWFEADGIPPDRLLFTGPSNTRVYLEEYGRIDIALDPFPYQGGSTTLDALWMGVPVVTLSGRLAVQRIGASMLKAVGLSELVAHSPEEYLEAALFLAGAVSTVPEARRNLREALKRSALMDEAGFVRDLEAAYRDMWRTWCARPQA